MTIRITPAHAGKTTYVAQFNGLSADHPRACGENSVGKVVFLEALGSPPRMRGKPCCFLPDAGFRRITPAHAGKTGDSEKGDLNGTDHPRACGENFALRVAVGREVGSPPRMRGKH